MLKQYSTTVFFAVICAAFVAADQPPRHMENLGRGVVAVRTNSSQVYVGWRMLGTEWGQNIGYHIYRGQTRITSSPITTSTNFVDFTSVNSTYRISAVINGIEGPLSEPAEVWPTFYKLIPLQRPAGGVTPTGEPYTYSPGDCSVGDLTGDGEYEIVVKWDPSNAKDNAHSGYSGNVYLDAYKLDGTFLWRIDLGRNIRAGAHYTQFMVYDLDSDGIAEVACKTAPGTIDGQGNYVLLGSDNPNADYRNSSGYILSGPEYLTIFNGQTGAAMATTHYVPPRGTVSQWGDNYGNRVDRFLAAVAYLDGERPSLVMARGYYTRTALAAWDWRNGELTQRWVFDTGHSGGPWSAYKGQGFHSLSVGDVDGDGFDEIIYGACVIDHDGTGLFTTGLGHGDAQHVGNMIPSRPGLEVWTCHETAAAGAALWCAGTGEILFEHYNSGDVGRAAAAHIDSRYVGYQLWSHATGGVFTNTNVQISGNRPASNFLAWWTGDLQREIIDVTDGAGKNPKIDKWGGNGVYRLLSLYNYPTPYQTNAINSTKGTPNLSADILGDWREELIYKTADNEHLIIFTTTDVTDHRFYTFMHDPMYRVAIAWQNVAYNQPPHPSFYVGAGMSPLPTPNIKLVDLDETPPWPDPMTWEIEPYESGLGEISMTATTAVDDGDGAVQYYFECLTDSRRNSGWQSSPVYVDEGIVQLVSTYRVKSRDTSSNLNETEWSDEVTVTISPYPYGGQARSIPDTIQAEHFDVGGSGVTYYDTTPGNSGGALRPYEDVDIVAITDGQAGYAIGDIETDEWLLYTVNSSQAQTDIYARVASTQAGGQILVWLDDELLATIDVPNTGSLTTWQTVSASSLPLPERENAKLKLEFVGTGFRLNWVQFGSQMPFGDVPSAIPGRVEFEDFDVGGQFISYYDKTPTNGYGHYRLDEAVDIQTIFDGGLGFAVYAEATEWLEYTCDIEAGFYTITVRSASPRTGGQELAMSADGQTRATFMLPNTGGWGTWQSTAVSGVYLPGGEQVLRFAMQTSDCNLNYVDFVRENNPADITQSGRVDLDDFAVLAAQWLGVPGVPSADIAPPGGDGQVDILDILFLAENWLMDR